ncbi:uncharacterized protein LOC112081895 [Eutrema salsugineum]|uniref:uncharacterized protein LOC112081895 n=1 Tax=Eutrema salsugineum TaxID=72664 RepID=UPI000CED365E|nr:uncharacterized protein LOC112081895 [Eutrema salsugineum]
MSNQSQSSGTESNASHGGGFKGYVKCHCGKVSVVRKAWTDDNPGRRFYGCGAANWKSCNFFRWFDAEKPQGWQKNALLEARDLIREQGDELKKLRAIVGEEGKEMAYVGEKSETSTQNTDMLLQLTTENNKLKEKLASSLEKEKLCRQFVVISWVRFVCVTAVIVSLGK